jgi:PAS domain S-box-containing protein
MLSPYIKLNLLMEKFLKILIVEDYPSDAELIMEEIKRIEIPFQHLIIETKTDYINALKDYKPDIIFSDYTLPDFDGLSALSIKEKLAPSVPFILVTGTLNEETAVEIMKAGADDYLIKGHIGRLGTAVKTALDKKEIIRQKKEAEQRLTILSRAVEQNPASIVLTDIKGNIEYVNPKFTELTGYSEIEILGKNPKILKTDESKSEDFKILWETITSGKEWRGEFQNRKKNGDIYFESALISPIADENGNITHFLAVKEDITERKVAEEVLRNYGLHLEETVKKRTTELELAKDKAESADKLKTAFLLNMSHELRTPLNSIIGFSGILLHEFPGPLNDEQKKQLGMIQSSGRHLLSLINDILDLSKIEAGQITANFEYFLLEEVLKEVIELEEPVAQNKGITISYINSPEQIEIFCDRKRILQVMLNLLNNAIKFTEKGMVTIRSYKDFEYVNIDVTDTGIGIKAEDISKLFKPFIQLENSLTRNYEGSGLGLSISKKLMELLRGDISVKSNYGSGTIFTVKIPLTINNDNSFQEIRE